MEPGRYVSRTRFAGRVRTWRYLSRRLCPCVRRDPTIDAKRELPAAHRLDRVPGADQGGPEEVVALIGEPARLRRIIATVVRLLDDRDER